MLCQSRISGRGFIAFLLFVVVCCLPGASAMAQASTPFKELAGIVTDPLGLRRSSSTLADSAERISLRLDAMIERADAATKARLEQIRDILAQLLSEAVSGSAAIVDQIATRVAELEAQVNRDAVNLIFRASCAANAVVTDGLDAFLATYNKLADSNPQLVIAGLKVVEGRAKAVQIDDPDKAYRTMKAMRFAMLRQTINDSTPAFDIVSTYMNLHRMARFTQCRYLGSETAEAIWMQEINDMERLMAPWNAAVRPRI